jgi:hypothetical protein
MLPRPLPDAELPRDEHRIHKVILLESRIGYEPAEKKLRYRPHQPNRSQYAVNRKANNALK